MAGRIRTIKPELIEDAITAGLSHAAFRLFVGMIVLADDHGNLRAAPRWLEGQVFHGSPIATCECFCNDTIKDLLGELGKKLVTLYEVDGQQYAHLNGWTKHQRIDNAGEPRVPLHPGWGWRHETYNDGKRTRSRVVLFPLATAAVLASPDLPSVATAAILGSQVLPPRQSLAGADLPSDDAAATNVTSDLPSVATAGSRSRSPTTKGGEEDAAAAAPTATPTPALKPDASQVRTELAKADDLWPDDDALTKAARRIADNVSDPMNRAKGEHVAVTREAITHARAFRTDKTLATADRLLAEAEKKVGWILADYRTGKRQKAGAVAPDKIGSHTVTEDFHDHERAEMERTAREAEKRRAEEAPPPTPEERRRMLADLNKRIGSGGRAA